MATTPAELKTEAEELLNDVEDVLPLVSSLPMPAEVKDFLTKAETFLKDVSAFLSA